MKQQRWTQPGFLGKVFGGGRHENFAINRKATANVPLVLQAHEVNLKWEDASWVNMNLPERVPNASPTAADIARLTKENEQFRIECEILLHLLTKAKLVKAKKQAELAGRKQRIQTLLEKIEARKAEEEREH
jgi:tRNA G37 N-methylase Trm5